MLIGSSPGYLMGYIVIAFVCAFVIVCFDVSRRNVSSERTPEKISVRFWFADNFFRVAANFLFIPIIIRGTYEHIGGGWMFAFACGIGFGVDYLGMIAKNAGFLTTTKLAERIKSNLDKV